MKWGVVAAIMRFREFSDGRVKVLVQGLFRCKVSGFQQSHPFICANFQKSEAPLAEETPDHAVRINTLIDIVKRDLKELTEISKEISSDFLFVTDSVTDPGRFIDLVASNLALPINLAQAILEIESLYDRLEVLKEFISLSLIKARSERSEMSSQMPWDSQMGQESSATPMDEMQELREKIEKIEMPEDVKKELFKQFLRLEKMHPEANESSMLRNYLDWTLSLPWEASTEDSIDLDEAKKVLDSEHYGLDIIKERILEFLAVKKLNAGTKNNFVNGQVLCFMGPPGVGKTSLGKSIAKAMGRKYQRIALGGVKEEAEIRGHRRTYVGSMPGKIIQALKKAGSNNPVIVLDELDKLGSSDFKGDPSAAFLEILDTEQNKFFRDNYINVDFDLSKVLFIGTSNYVEGIPAALLDRLDVIRVPSYILDDKIQICKNHLIPKVLEEHGLKKEQLSINNTALEYLIVHYTKEAGVRSIRREIASLCRKAAKIFVTKPDVTNLNITVDVLKNLLGREKFVNTDVSTENRVGVVNGLAWTQVGGELLVIEALKMKGQGRPLKLTGHLGDVMKESAQAALSYAKAHHKELKIPLPWFFYQ